MLVLVGNKVDLRVPGNKSHMTFSELKKLGKVISSRMKKSNASILSKKVYVHEISCMNDPQGVTDIVQGTIASFLTGGSVASSKCPVS